MNIINTPILLFVCVWSPEFFLIILHKILFGLIWPLSNYSYVVWNGSIQSFYFYLGTHYPSSCYYVSHSLSNLTVLPSNQAGNICQFQRHLPGIGQSSQLETPMAAHIEPWPRGLWVTLSATPMYHYLPAHSWRHLTKPTCNSNG